MGYNDYGTGDGDLFDYNGDGYLDINEEVEMLNEQDRECAEMFGSRDDAYSSILSLLDDEDDEEYEDDDDDEDEDEDEDDEEYENNENINEDEDNEDGEEYDGLIHISAEPNNFTQYYNSNNERYHDSAAKTNHVKQRQNSSRPTGDYSSFSDSKVLALILAPVLFIFAIAFIMAFFEWLLP